MAEELKPCPFCGEAMEKSEFLSTIRRAVFTHPTREEDRCILDIVDIRIAADDAERIAAWNRRPAEDALTERVRELEADGQFLLDRLSDFEPELETGHGFRDWAGHVSPAIARFRSLLTKGAAK